MIRCGGVWWRAVASGHGMGSSEQRCRLEHPPCLSPNDAGFMFITVDFMIVYGFMDGFTLFNNLDSVGVHDFMNGFTNTFIFFFTFNDGVMTFHFMKMPSHASRSRMLIPILGGSGSSIPWPAGSLTLREPVRRRGFLSHNGGIYRRSYAISRAIQL